MTGKSQTDSTAQVLTSSFGPMAKVGAHSLLERDARVGFQAQVGKFCVIERDAVILDRALIEDYVTVPAGVTVGEKACIGPHVTFADGNGQYPAAGERTSIGEGARIGANCVILRGVSIGRYALIGPGCLVTQDVQDFARVASSPSQQDGWVCQCGKPLNLPLQGERRATCSCGRTYSVSDGQLTRFTQLGE
jgi:UDP-2-acetamido-3-amino-2,3-dideoxy-glucuronate N-acetyltransferase